MSAQETFVILMQNIHSHTSDAQMNTRLIKLYEISHKNPNPSTYELTDFTLKQQRHCSGCLTNLVELVTEKNDRPPWGENLIKLHTLYYFPYVTQFQAP